MRREVLGGAGDVAARQRAGELLQNDEEWPGGWFVGAYHALPGLPRSAEWRKLKLNRKVPRSLLLSLYIATASGFPFDRLDTCA